MGTTRPRRHWLFKSEPEVYGIDAFEAEGRTLWTGVRNYQARNLLRDEVRPGDGVLFYHSNADPMAVVGLAEVVASASADPTQFDPKSPYHDPKSTVEDPRWLGVEIAFVARLPRVVTRATLKAEPRLADMMLLQRGARLSIQPVTEAHWAVVLELGGYVEGRQSGRRAGARRSC